MRNASLIPPSPQFYAQQMYSERFVVCYTANTIYIKSYVIVFYQSCVHLTHLMSFAIPFLVIDFFVISLKMWLNNCE